jgi:translation initiation factor IF-1
MSSADLLEVEGVIVKQHANQRFTVQLETGQNVEAYLTGRMSKAFIRVVPGDAVVVALSPYNVTLGRIVKRL